MKAKKKIYELEERADGTLAVKKPKKGRGIFKKATIACGAALGVAFEFLMGFPVYAVIAVVALFTLPSALAARAKKHAAAGERVR